jgi:transcriptional regulator with XRE-family HTH domain
LGTAARLIRRLTGLPQDEFAHRTGLSQGFLSQLENGMRQLTSVEKVIRFFDGLEAPVDLLPLPTRRDICRRP